MSLPSLLFKNHRTFCVVVNGLQYLFLRFAYASICSALFFFASGCSSQKTTAVSSPSSTITITAQPISQTVPIGQAATFSVSATGSGTLNYQWNKNGVPINGATAASYTTSPVSLETSESTSVGSFQVVVSNSSSSATSNIATLSAGPRSPKPGDIRYLPFEQVTLPKFWGQSGGGGSNLSVLNYSFANSLGTPLGIGNTVSSGNLCSWNFSYYTLPSPMNNYAMYYQVGFLNTTTIASYLQSVASPNTVINSMDIQPQVGCETIGVSWIETSQNEYDLRLELVAPSQVSAQIAKDGQSSRIVTAASFDEDGNAYLLSYGWTEDTNTIYETIANIVRPNQVGTIAQTMAAEGYFISAFGGNDANGYIIIGARVKGDTLPRPMNINGTLASNPGSAYFTPVILLYDNPTTENPSGVTVQALEQ